MSPPKVYAPAHQSFAEPLWRRKPWLVATVQFGGLPNLVRLAVDRDHTQMCGVATARSAISTENRSRLDCNRSRALRADVSPLPICGCGCSGRDAAASPSTQFAQSAAPPKAKLPARSVETNRISTLQPEPLRLPNSAIEPIEWNALNGWRVDDHAAALATFLTSCRPLLRASVREGDKRPMYLALTQVCRQALAVGRLTDDQARFFFERNFRPLRITKLGDSAGLLTGYYEPIVDGSRFPTGIFKVPIYRRPPDLVPPRNSAGPGFPNKGQSLRRTSSGTLVPYYDRGEILDGALDGKHPRACRSPRDARLPSTTRCMCTARHFSSKPTCHLPARSGASPLID
jgi:MltA specific insert domain